VEKQGRPGLTWLWFSLLRLGIFAVVLAILLLILPVPPWVSTIVAALIAFCISFIFLSRPRAQLAVQLDRMRRGEANGAVADDDAEDAAFGTPDARG
jgi:predicted membrane metal-binding protein